MNSLPTTGGQLSGGGNIHYLSNLCYRFHHTSEDMVKNATFAPQNSLENNIYLTIDKDGTPKNVSQNGNINNSKINLDVGYLGWEM